MKDKKVKEILKEVLERITPPKDDLNFINNSLKHMLEEIKSRAKKSKLDMEIFVGGSFAKGTVIKKMKYDVDVFLRYDKNKYKEQDISEITKNLISGLGKIVNVHGSRDYFRIIISDNFFIELIPVIKIKNIKEADNITDLSYSHVKYINGKIKNDSLKKEIMLAKAFCHAQNCYGAESYINGFSGYGLELLIYHYKSFMKMLQELSKFNTKNNNKLIIDIEKHYKNKSQILMDLNSSKMHSPIILIDPTFPQRNVLAALSNSTFEAFQQSAKQFLSSPSVKLFEQKKIDFNIEKANAPKRKEQFILIECETLRQEGDIAGSKLLKFYNHLQEEVEKYFELKKSGFEYNDKQKSKFYFSTKPKKEILSWGPFIKDIKNSQAFRKEHKKVLKKNGRLYIKYKMSETLNEFIKNWLKKNQEKIKDMSISNVKILE